MKKKVLGAALALALLMVTGCGKNEKVTESYTYVLGSGAKVEVGLDMSDGLYALDNLGPNFEVRSAEKNAENEYVTIFYSKFLSNSGVEALVEQLPEGVEEVRPGVLVWEVPHEEDLVERDVLLVLGDGQPGVLLGAVVDERLVLDALEHLQVKLVE